MPYPHLYNSKEPTYFVKQARNLSYGDVITAPDKLNITGSWVREEPKPDPNSPNSVIVGVEEYDGLSRIRFRKDQMIQIYGNITKSGEFI